MHDFETLALNIALSHLYWRRKIWKSW